MRVVSVGRVTGTASALLPAESPRIPVRCFLPLNHFAVQPLGLVGVFGNQVVRFTRVQVEIVEQWPSRPELAFPEGVGGGGDEINSLGSVEPGKLRLILALAEISGSTSSKFR